MKRIQLLLLTYLVLFSLISCYATTGPKPLKSKEFEIKGFHLDLRIQVMKLDALKDYASELASFGINTLIMEWEGTFPFKAHPLIPNKYAYTLEEIEEFITHCAELDIEVIPMQQSLGHLEYVLRHARYDDQREDPEDVSQICPMEPELNKELFEDLISEMAKAHPSKYFHIGGDEAYLFGHCDKCSAKIARDGKSSLLTGHLKMVCEVVTSLGKVPVLWADIANRYPDELSQLPKETIFIVWNYGWALDRFGDPGKITQYGFEVWGAPSLRSNPDNFYLTRWQYHFENIRDFIPVSRESGYNGIIMTSWSTSGLYSTIFEDKQTITDLIAQRNVYPISGFRMLLAAYAQALNQTEPLDIIQFVTSYCQSRYGLNEAQAQQFFKAIKGIPEQVIDAKVEGHPELTVEMLLTSARQDQITLNNLHPTSNSEEFEHYRLMTDIRENYLAFKQVEYVVNKKDFKVEMIPDILDQLKVILEKNEALNERFRNLNSDLLFSSEIENENQIRTKRVQLLFDRLARIRV